MDNLKNKKYKDLTNEHIYEHIHFIRIFGSLDFSLEAVHYNFLLIFIWGKLFLFWLLKLFQSPSPFHTKHLSIKIYKGEKTQTNSHIRRK